MLNRARTDDIDNRERRAQAQQSEFERLTNPDGSTRVVRIGEPRHNIGDVYHFLMTSAWWQFFGAIFVAYIGVNFIFALAYHSVRAEIVNCATLADAFFFSVQTIASIGYGHIVPIGFTANAIVTIEAFIGMLSVAIGAGLVFARFTRPQAGVMFSKRAVITMHDGELMLMFRLANRRRTHINQASVAVVLAYDDKTAEGETTRRLKDLTLRRNMSPTFVLSWTVRHVIDQTSPFYGRTREELCDLNAEIVVVFTGFHESFNQTVHARYAYAIEDVHWNHKLVDIFTIIEDGRRALDFSRFDLTVPDDASG